MWIETPVFQEDLESIAQEDYIPWEQLQGKTCLITGATGLIGYTLTSALLYAGWKKQLGLTVVALVRNVEKAKQKFAAQLNQGLPLRFVQGDVEHLPPMDGPVDYVIHGASPTASKYFVEHPVETIHTAVIGTMNMMRMAKDKQCQGFVYLSSMEVYGSPQTDEKITESHSTNLDTMVARNSYPESKRLCESLCASYWAEYGLRAMSVRLTQTFGPGVDYNDNRVFAQFARSVIEGKDIVLLTKGETRRSYLYTADAVTAILTVLLKGQGGQAYNAANEDTYCSIYEMAELFADGKVQVKIQCNEAETKQFAPVLRMNLSVSKLNGLGWNASVGIRKMNMNMIAVMVSEEKVW